MEWELVRSRSIVSGGVWRSLRDHVEGQSSASSRDLLLLVLAEIRQYVFTGALTEAHRSAVRAQNIIRQARDLDALTDLAPLVLIACANAHVLHGAGRHAMGALHDARRWAAITAHPAGSIADAYSYFAQEILATPRTISNTDASLNPSRTKVFDGAIASRLGGLGRAVERLAVGDVAAVETESARLGMDIRDPGLPELDTFWWVGAHLVSGVRLLAGDADVRAKTIGWLRGVLADNGSRAGADSLAGWLLRADLADLQQSVGAYRHASRTLAELPEEPLAPAAVVSRARLYWLQGDRERAQQVLRRVDQFDPLNSVELDALRYRVACDTGDATRTSMYRDVVTSSLSLSGRWSALVNVPRGKRKALAARVVNMPEIADPFVASVGETLTPREREVLEQLRADDTIRTLATRLYISPETAKSHLHSLYRKIGARTRREALIYRTHLLAPEEHRGVEEEQGLDLD